MGKQNMNKLILIAAIAVAAVAVDGRRVSEGWTREQNVAAGIDHEGSHITSPLPQDYIKDEDLPTNFTWGDVDGVNYLTKSLNQHIPQYCGSCWAHGSVSALGDRIKIARKAKGIDINLSVQHMLNCGNIGSCHGGSVPGPYQWIHKISKTGAGISYDTSNPYMACSSESDAGICKGRLELHTRECGQDLLHLRSIWLLRPHQAVPQRHNLAIWHHLWRQQHGEGDHGSWSYRMRHRCFPHFEVHWWHRLRSWRDGGPCHLYCGLGQRGFQAVLDRAQLLGRVLGRDGLCACGERQQRTPARDPVLLGCARQVDWWLWRDSQQLPLL